MGIMSKTSDPVVIAGYARTPMGGFQGVFAPVKATELGAAAVRAAVERSGAPADAVEQIIMGCVLPAGLGQAPARQAALGAGLPKSVEATTVNKMCGSGMQAAILARIARSATIDVLQEDFIRTARAKGLGRSAVLWRHALRNALIPVITIMGIQFAQLLVGAIVIEQVFSLPGLGRLVFQAISNRDLAVVKAVVILLAFMVVTVNFVVDLLYAVIDPRLSARDA